MEAVPSMWRTELWHPLVVHFPIALLLVGTLFRIGGAAAGRKRLAFLRPAGQTLLVLGTAGVWAAVYTGSLADSVVVRSLCDPTVLETHENLSYTTAYLFSGYVAADLVRFGMKRWFSPDAFRAATLFRRALLLVALGLTLAGSATLVYVSHLGSSLVYQQAAAVNQPSEDCRAFE